MMFKLEWHQGRWRKVDEFELFLEVYITVDEKEELWQRLGLGLEQLVNSNAF